MTDIVTRLDDTDPGITYEGQWIKGGKAGIEYNGTTHGTKKAFSSAQLVFNGKQIKIFATLDAKRPKQPNPISDILLDGGLEQTFNPTLTSAVQYDQLIYSSRTLENGQHTVNITSKLDSNNSIWIDYFEILSSEPGTSGSPVTTSSMEESSTLSITDSGVGAGTDQNTPAGTRSTALPIGGIVGLILGVLLLISVLFIGFFRWRRSRISARTLAGYNSTDIQAFPYHLKPSGGFSIATQALDIEKSSTAKQSPRSRNDSSVSQTFIDNRRPSEYPPSYSSG